MILAMYGEIIDLNLEAVNCVIFTENTYTHRYFSLFVTFTFIYLHYSDY